MSIYRSQAERVYKHIKEGIKEPEIMKQFNFTIERFEKDIEKAVERSGKNGKFVADTMIKLFDEQKGFI
jgi:hypothetical protein